MLSGLDILVSHDFAPWHGWRIGLVTHPAAVDARFRSATELCAGIDGVTLSTLFGPEHGLCGQAQDLIGVGHDDGRAGSFTGRVISLYGDSAASLRPTDDQLRGLDALVIDLQDCGSRYYTFQATMLYCLEAALPRGMRVVVLDRPNPINGADVEGPALAPGFESFIGAHNVPIRHGLTIGELAHLYREERGLTGGELEVVPCSGWKRTDYFDETGMPWVLPSPNLPTLESAVVYPGQCLLEGTNLSEGRGTTRPFEMCGAPWIDADRLAGRLNDEALPGVVFRPAWFQPTFQKHAGQLCGGVQLHVTDRAVFHPVRAGLCVLAHLRELSGPQFRWRTETYEFVDDPIAIDLLFGSSRERLALENNCPWREIAAEWEPEESAFRARRRDFLLYE